jgi:DNA-binding NtrC family response regulator
VDDGDLVNRLLTISAHRLARARGLFVLDVSDSHVANGRCSGGVMSYVFTQPLPEIPASSLTPNEIVPLLIGATVGEVERELVLQTLIRCNGNRTRAARVLGVSVRTLRNKIRTYSADGIEVPAPND